MKLEIYNSVHTSESVPSRVNVWQEKETHTYTHRGREQVREWESEGGDLISYASADHTACGTVKSLEQNTALNDELYVHNNIFHFLFDIHVKKASGFQNKNKDTALNNKK